MTHPPSSSGKFPHSFIESSFHLLRLHFITAEFLENKNIKHQSRTCFLTYFDDHWKQWSFYASLSPLCFFFVITPIFCNPLHPKAITAFGEMHNFKRNFHAELQKLNATFLSKALFLRALWISLSMLTCLDGDSFFSSPRVHWKGSEHNCPFQFSPLVTA